MLEYAEIGSAIDGHFGSARYQSDEDVAAFVICNDTADGSGGRVGYGDFGAAHGIAFRVDHRSGQRGGIELGGALDEAAQNQDPKNKRQHTHLGLHVSSALQPGETSQHR